MSTHIINQSVNQVIDGKFELPMCDHTGFHSHFYTKRVKLLLPISGYHSEVFNKTLWTTTKDIREIFGYSIFFMICGTHNIHENNK